MRIRQIRCWLVRLFSVLGIGKNTAILSTVNGLILYPLPVEKPDELVSMFCGSSSEMAHFGAYFRMPKSGRPPPPG